MREGCLSFGQWARAIALACFGPGGKGVVGLSSFPMLSDIVFRLRYILRRMRTEFSLLKHFAIGDAYVAPFEFVPRAGWPCLELELGHPVRPLQHCVEGGYNIAPGAYTDDTQMSLALGLASLSEHYQADLPEALYTGLEAGPWGRDYLQVIDRRLAERFLHDRAK